MIRQEHIDVSGRDFVRTYSDSGRFVVRDGVEYTEACDPAEFGRTYTEGDIISDYDDDATAEEYEEWQREHENPEPEPTADPATPAWDITQGEYIPEGFLLTRNGVVYKCLVGHYAAWNKQPPNDEYWRAI